MGDVFDAMNRAKRELGRPLDAQAPTPGGDQPSDAQPPRADQPSVERQPADDAAPALPLDQINAKPQGDDRPEPVELSAQPVTVTRAAASRSHVADAVAKADAEKDAARKNAGNNGDAAADSHRTGTALPTGSHDPSLNGYAPQVIVHHDRGSLITEQYRAIRTQILARSRNRRLQTHVITSSSPEEGKSVTTLNLGMAFSELRNQKTLLIEADLRRPTFHTLLHRSCNPGLIHLLRGEISEVDKAIHPTVYDNLQVLPAGDRDITGSTELLSSPRMQQILDRLKDRYDHIFIDTPPVITVTDACILGAIADETILVVRLNQTPAELVDRAKRLLRAANCELAGVILTHLHAEPQRYMYRYRYRYA